MKHIHNTMKRVLAATLSILTVASPIGANVGVFLTEGAKLVASAGEGDSNPTGGQQQTQTTHLVGSIKPGTTISSGDIIKNPVADGKPVGGDFYIFTDADAYFNAVTTFSGTDMSDDKLEFDDADKIPEYLVEKYGAYHFLDDVFVKFTDGDYVFVEGKELFAADMGAEKPEPKQVGHVLFLQSADKVAFKGQDMNIKISQKEIENAVLEKVFFTEKIDMTDDMPYYRPVDYGAAADINSVNTAGATFVGLAKDVSDELKLVEKANSFEGSNVHATVNATTGPEYQILSQDNILDAGIYYAVFRVSYGATGDGTTYMLYPFIVMEEPAEPLELSSILSVEFAGAIKEENVDPAQAPTVPRIPYGTAPGATLMLAPASEGGMPTEVENATFTYYKKGTEEGQWDPLILAEPSDLEELGLNSYKVEATFELIDVFEQLTDAQAYFPDAQSLNEIRTFTAYFDVVKGEIAEKDKYEVRQENFTYGTESAPTPALYYIFDEGSMKVETTNNVTRNIGSVVVQYLPNYPASGDPNRVDGDLTSQITTEAPTDASKYNWVRMEVKPVDGERYNSFFTPWVRYTINKAELTRGSDDADILAEPTLFDPEIDKNAEDNRYRAYDFLNEDQPVFKNPANLLNPAKTGVKYAVITKEEYINLISLAGQSNDILSIIEGYNELKNEAKDSFADVKVKDVGEYIAVWFYTGDDNHNTAPAVEAAIDDYYAAKDAYEQARQSSHQEQEGQSSLPLDEVQDEVQMQKEILMKGSNLPSLKNSGQANLEEAVKQVEVASRNVVDKFREFIGKNTASLEVKYATVPLSLVGLDDDAEDVSAVLTTIVKGDNSVDEVKVERVGNNLSVTGNNTYMLYTNKSLNADQNYIALVKNIDENVEFKGQAYNYCYTLRIPAVPQNGYMLSHDTSWAGRVKTSNTAVLEVDDNTKFDHAVEVAEINKDIEYYYGDKPDVKDVIVNEGYNNVVKVNRVFFTNLANTVEVATPEAGQKYNATAEVYIDPTGQGNFEVGNANVVYLKKEVEYNQRPLSLCDAYQVIDGEEVLISRDNKLQDTVYNRKEQSVQIVFRNPAIKDEANPNGVMLATTDYDLSTDWATAKDADTYTLTYKGMNPNYAADKRVFTWTIKKAELQIKATPKDNIVYDGKALDDTDFTFTGDDSDLISTEGTTVGVTSNEEGGNITNAGKTTAKITIKNSNYKDLELPVPTVINRRKVTLTPAANQNQIYGSKMTPKIEYTIEQMNATNKTGVVENEENVLLGKIRVGTEIATTNVQKPGTTDRYDYVNYVNDAGTYEYVLDGLDDVTNYAVTIATGYSFTVKPKTVTENMFTINEGYDEFYYNSQDQGPHKEYVADDGKFLLSADRDMLTAADYRQYGTEEACLPGTYYLEFAGKNNYTGYVRKAWTIKSTSQESGVHAESFIYNGKNIEDNKKLTLDKVAIQDVKQTVTYYGGYDGEADLNEELLSKLTKLDKAPIDAGNYVVVVKTTATGAVFEDQYAAFTIAQRPITVVPKTTEGYYSDKFDLSYDVDYNFNADKETGVLEGEDAEITGTLGIEDPDGNVGKRKFTTDGLTISNPNYTAVVEDTFEIKRKQIKNSDLKVVSEAIINNDGVAVVEDAVKVVVNGKELTKYNPETGKGDYRVVSATTTSKEEAFSIQIRGTNNYATSLASTTVQVASSKSRITGYAVIDNQNRIGFTADTTYTGDVKNAKAGVEVKRPKGDGTFEFNDLELPVGVSTFKVRDLGYGAEAKPYVEVNGVRVYGETVTVAAADLKNDTTYVPIAVNNAVKYDNQNRVAFTVISGKDNNVTACGVEVYRDGADAKPTVLELPVGASSFRAKDLGKGIIIKPFTVDKNGKKTYGATYTTSYAEVTSPVLR